MNVLLTLLMAAVINLAEPDPTEADIAWVAQGGFCEPETVLALIPTGFDNTVIAIRVPAPPAN